MRKPTVRGARAELIGRPFLYGLGAGGKGGAVKCLEMIRNEPDVTMAMTGMNNIGEIDRSVLM